MNNVSSLKSNNTQSSKTPGGISKSLLTPCRRVGLSRNWKKSGPSPFISPLGNNAEVKHEKVETRKRKERGLDLDIQKTPKTSVVDNDHGVTSNENADLEKTPSRNTEIPRRKKSKTLISAINKSEDINTDLVINQTCENNTHEESTEINCPENENKEVISTPVRTKSKKSRKKSPRNNSILKDANNDFESIKNTEIQENTDSHTQNKAQESVSTSEKSPNDLRRECIVVIQKKVFKNIENELKTEKSTSQTLFDSDSDEVPLIKLNKNDKPDDDDDFINNKIKPHKYEHIKSPKTKSKKPKIEKIKISKPIIEPKPSQSSYDDEDDDFDDKKTILIRKTYEKLSKPHKAKSTGSITQQDIDELKARIEMKKKLLLAKSLTPETAELRSLIKRWQKGCQDALMELLDLMKGKFPEQNMDYSEMLKALKIPESLVGYDPENDCFISPNDESIVLGKFRDLDSF